MPWYICTYKKQRLLYSTLRTAGHRKWDTYGVLTGKNEALISLQKVVLTENVKEPRSAISSAVSDSINIDVEMAPDEDFF